MMAATGATAAAAPNTCSSIPQNIHRKAVASFENAASKTKLPKPQFMSEADSDSGNDSLSVVIGPSIYAGDGCFSRQFWQSAKLCCRLQAVAMMDSSLRACCCFLPLCLTLKVARPMEC